MKSRELILTGLGQLDRSRGAGRGVSPFRFAIEECTPEELEILELARRKVTVRRLAWATGGLAFSRLRAVYALAASGRPACAADAALGARSPSSSSRPAPSCSPRCSGSPTPRASPRSAARCRRSWSARPASTARPGSRSRAPPRARSSIRALEDKMERYHALRDARGRRGADQDRHRGDPRAAPPRCCAWRARPRPREPPSRCSARRRRPPPRPPSRAGRPRGARPGGSSTPAMSPSPAPRGRRARRSHCRPRRPGAPRRASPSAHRPARRSKRGAVGVGASNFEGRAQIEHLLMEGEVRMTVSDYANAVKVYERLVELRAEGRRLPRCASPSPWPAIPAPRSTPSASSWRRCGSSPTTPTSTTSSASTTRP